MADDRNKNNANLEPARERVEVLRKPMPTYLKRILLVDSQAHVLRVMKLSLDRNGHEVDTALSAEVALSMMSEIRYDAIITDDELSKMDGRLLCQDVKLIFAEKAPLMFLLVENLDASVVAWQKKNQYVECLEKPVSLRWLVARLSEVFGHLDKAVGS